MSRGNRTLTQEDIDAARAWKPAAIARAGGTAYDDGEPAPEWTVRFVVGVWIFFTLVLIALAVATYLALDGRIRWA
jgi:hypothetical protein